MSQNFIKDMVEFTREMSKHDHRQVIRDKPSDVSDELYRLRRDLISEEVAETAGAMYLFQFKADLSRSEQAKLLAAIADGIADSIVVLIGTALAYGIPLQKVWDEVHRSNMEKVVKFCDVCNKDGKRAERDYGCLGCGGSLYFPFTPNKRDDGKILKPEGWTPPRIQHIIEEAMK